MTSIGLNSDESLVAGCGTSMVAVFDITTSHVIQTVPVPCQCVALIDDKIVTGDADGTLGMTYDIQEFR